MSGEGSAIFGPAIVFSAPAGADLSGSQFFFVKWSSGTFVVCAAVTDVPAGVLQNKPILGRPAEVIAHGGTFVMSSAAIAQGASIGTDATGKAETKVAGTDTTEYVTGRTLKAAAGADELVSALVNCISPHRAA